MYEIRVLIFSKTLVALLNISFQYIPVYINCILHLKRLGTQCIYLDISNIVAVLFLGTYTLEFKYFCFFFFAVRAVTLDYFVICNMGLNILPILAV
jgi:hypothetical protein